MPGDQGTGVRLDKPTQLRALLTRDPQHPSMRHPIAHWLLVLM
jgi:hypothetical protein